MNRKIFRFITLFFVFGLSIMVAGCGDGSYTAKNKNADDRISRVIYDQLGTELYYEGSSFDDINEIMYYHYVINDYEDENLLIDTAETVNEMLEKYSINSKICIVIREIIPTGTRSMVCLSNYYENDSEYESYETLQCLDIRGSEGGYERYNEVSTYENLEDIKVLILEVGINKSFEEEGVDWYEIWPDLEHYDIYDAVHRTRTPK